MHVLIGRLAHCALPLVSFHSAAVARRTNTAADNGGVWLADATRIFSLHTTTERRVKRERCFHRWCFTQLPTAWYHLLTHLYLLPLKEYTAVAGERSRRRTWLKRSAT